MILPLTLRNISRRNLPAVSEPRKKRHSLLGMEVRNQQVFLTKLVVQRLVLQLQAKKQLLRMRSLTFTTA